MKKPGDNHKDKLFFYRKREDDLRALIGKDPALDDRLKRDADAWARLRAAREFVKREMDDMVRNIRS